MGENFINALRDENKVVWHMHYCVTSYGRMLTMFYISNHDQRYKEGDEECDAVEY
jgi:hypothetical protein